MDLSGDAITLWDAARALSRRALEDRASEDRALEDGAVARATATVSRAPPPLLFMTDPDRTPEPWITAACLPPGAAVIHRHFGAAEADATARRLRQATRAAGVLLLIGRDDALAERVEADGVHLPEWEMGRAAALRARHPDWLLTGAAHGAQTPASSAGLDALVLSPVFPAGGASAARPALGVERFAAAVRASSPPIYALGGVTAANVGRLADTGACGVAGIAAIQDAFRPNPRT